MTEVLIFMVLLTTYCIVALTCVTVLANRIGDNAPLLWLSGLLVGGSVVLLSLPKVARLIKELIIYVGVTI